MTDSEKTVELLRQASSYADGTRSVQVVETHISWVFLTSEFAYKLKKPVRFEFLDFSTPELRRRACMEELRLNRRLAPDVYLAVLPITQNAAGELELDGGGADIDWVVQMRRLPAPKAMDALLRQRRLSAENAAALARYLAHFYAELAPEPVSATDYCGALDRHVRANALALFDELPAERIRIRRIRSAQLRFLRVAADLFARRVDSGRIVDGHGDLRPEHVYLEDPPAVIDCVEFSAELRRVDIADELSFLAMECEQIGGGGVGELVLSTYRSACHDEIPEQLLAFYRGYRACVRAKVVAIRAGQETQEGRRPSLRLVRRYLAWADKYAAELGRPSIVVIGGLMGTGKSTLAVTLSEAMGAERLSTDSIRREMLGASKSPAGYGEANYEPGLRQRVYEELLRQAGVALQRSCSVILDGTFLTRGLRQQARDLAVRSGAVALFVLCECPREAALHRIQGRATAENSLSEARAELYDVQSREFEPLGDCGSAITLDTTHDLTRLVNSVCGELRNLLF